MRMSFMAAAAAIAVAPLAAKAATPLEGLTWQAVSTVVGATSTATIGSGGNPIYAATAPRYSGVVALIMQEPTGAFICSGSLLSDRRSILTAGHCVSSGAGTANPISTTAYFYGGGNPDLSVPFNPAATAVSVSDYFVDPLYTGQVIDQNDIAVVRLATEAPAFATSYNLYNSADLTGQQYNIAGYGARSDVGGDVGADLNPGRLRQGDNRYDFRLGDPDFDGFFNDFFEPDDPAANAFSYLSDFDNGLMANDASCQLAGAFGLGGPKYCDGGLGAFEVSTAGGDSGGPEFINGAIASITSYGLTFGAGLGDIDDSLNSTFGEFNGFVPTFIHTGFILGAMVPEPSSWSLMILGFGSIGAAMRGRRRRLSAA